MATMIRDDTMAYQPKPPRHQDGGKGRPTKTRGKLISVEAVDPQWPCNLEAERKLIFSVLAAPETFGDYADIAASDFFHNKYAAVWQAMLDVHEAGEHRPNLEATTDRLYQVYGLSEVGGQGFLTDITASGDTSSTFNAPTFAAIVRRTAAQRKLMKRGADLVAQAAARDADPDEVLARFQSDAEAIVAARQVGTDDPNMFDLRQLMAMDLPPAKWVIPQHVPEGLTVLAAKPKIGKSWLALGMVLATGAGGTFLGQEVRPRAALYLALEDNQRRLQARVKLILGDEPIPERVTLATKWPRLDRGGLVKMERWLKAKTEACEDPGVIVIDVLAKVMPPRQKNADPYAEEYAVIGQLQELCFKYSAGIFVIHHTRKAAAEDIFDEVRGTVASGADCTMVLQRSRGEADATLHITGRDVDETALALRMDKARGSWALLGKAEDVAHNKRQLAILATLEEADAPLSPSEVAKTLGEAPAPINLAMWRMAKNAEIKALERGKYTTIDALQQNERKNGKNGKNGYDGKVGNISNLSRGYADERLENPVSIADLSNLSNLSAPLEQISSDEAREERDRLLAWAEAHSFPAIHNDLGIFLPRGERAWRSYIREALPRSVRELVAHIRAEGGEL